MTRRPNLLLILCSTYWSASTFTCVIWLLCRCDVTRRLNLRQVACSTNRSNVHVYICDITLICRYAMTRRPNLLLILCSTYLRAVPKCLKHPAGCGQKLIHGRDIELWKFYCNFSKYSSSRWILGSLWPNTEACVIEALAIWCACYLHDAGAILPALPPIAAHKTTDFANHTPTNLYRQTNLYRRKFWPETPKLSQVQICSQVQEH